MELIDFLAYALFIEIDVIFALAIIFIVYSWTMANKDPKEFDHYNE